MWSGGTECQNGPSMSHAGSCKSHVNRFCFFMFFLSIAGFLWHYTLRVTRSIIIYLFIYVFLSQLAHKANSFLLQPIRSNAAASASLVDIVRSLRSREMVCLQVVRLSCPVFDSSWPALGVCWFSCGSDDHTKSDLFSGVCC